MLFGQFLVERGSATEEQEKKFGEIAIELMVLSEEEVDVLLVLQKEKNPHVGEILVRQGVLDKDKLFEEINVFLRRREV